MLFPASFLVALATQCPDPTPPPAGFLIDEAVDLAIDFSDGETTTAVVRWPRDPAGPCGWPLIVFTHGLNGSRASVAGVAREFAELGYVTVAYDLRGHDTASGFQTLWGQRERLDIVELIEWVQVAYGGLVDPERIGLGGVSQGGIMSFSTAAFGGQPIESNPWRSGIYPQIDAIAVENLTGGFAPTFAPHDIGVHTNLGTAFLSPGEVRYAPEVIASLTYAVLTGDSTPWVSLVSDPTRDFGPRADTMTTAVLAMGCWDDFWFPPEQLLTRMGEIPATTPKKLYIGAVGHSTPANVEQRDRRNEWRRQWFDRHLKAIDNGIDAGPWVTYAATPADVATYLDVNSSWAHAAVDEWPPPNRHDYAFYLSDQQRLSVVAPKNAEPADSLAQAVLGNFSSADLLAAQFRLPLIEPFIPRVHLQWDSAPLPTELGFVGSPRVQLHLDCADTTWQIGVSLWDVDALGEERYVTSTSYFTSTHPGGAVERVLELEPNAYTFPAGHRVRLRVENMHIHEPPVAQLLRYAPNVNPFTVDVLHAPSTPSALYLPVEAGAGVGFGWSQTNSQGCLPQVAANGAPSLASNAPFTIDATAVLNNKDGLFLYSFERKKKVIGGGSLWLGSPLVRTGRVDSGGNSGPDDCSGAYSYDFGARMRGGLYSNLVAGERIYGQFWSRDPQASGGTNLTHGLEFTIQP
jgi:predicted acyl esterase